jgi:hypothetical protein
MQALGYFPPLRQFPEPSIKVAEGTDVEMHRLEARNLELVKELADIVQSVTDREEVGSYLER